MPLEYPRVKVIKIGTLRLEPHERPGPTLFGLKGELGIGGGSTVTLVESDRVVLVDTGFDFEECGDETNRKRNAEILEFALRSSGVAPETVDAVFITHWHRDHFGNLSLFPRAEHLVSVPLWEKLGRPGFRPVKDGEEIADGVKVIYTPGHTDHHASVLVAGRLAGLRARIAVAGDAVISYSYFAQGKIWRHNADFYDHRQALESQTRLAELSDIIIPGHGVPFATAPRPKKPLVLKHPSC
ncbi:MBL fold metallo-hydrolase [Thermodesulforhabdus norvegica]|uniref:Metallo-beta-lactamase domain-containing protein 1 n=1 Tax=Thermodesulforhabdus norvegica TaxID=39841 RepID=A0A1I4VF40_9BACT|nr:MBL fold metallo-hydrolase [Thermodesulforhabdus norvegica]SFM99736.1 Glyoxylase, beta-lactamase superfamily II [Thermodesulforhabdus norvegica]